MSAVNNSVMLEFLMEHDVTLVSMTTKKSISADEAFLLGGEFIVLNEYSTSELYRGTDFDEALKELEKWI
jgi:hypothetical protein